MSKHLVAPVLLFGSVCIASCSGVQLNPVSNINKAMPQDMLGRSVVTDSEIMKRHLEEIPGYIMEETDGGKLEQVALILDDYVPKVLPLQGDDAFYHSIVDSEAGAKGSYLELITAELKGKLKAEVTVTETAEAWIPRKDVPWNKIAAWAAANPAHGRRRYYIQGVLLTLVTKTVFSEVSSNATVDGGAAFGFGGKVYATNRTTETTRIHYIGAHLLDIDKIKEHPPTEFSTMELKNYTANPRIIHTMQLNKK